MDDSSIALRRVNVRSLNRDMSNVLIVGIIIGKQKPKKFLDKKAPVEFYKAVWNFTIRDSPQDYINISYWESSEVLFQKNDNFHVGDVEIINPKISLRRIDDYGEQFRPMVTSPYHLTLSEKSNLIRHESAAAPFLNLLSLPTKPLAGFLPLRDIHNSGSSIKDTFVDVLAVVKNLGPIRSVTLKKGNEALQVRTVEVFDYTCPGAKIDIWESDIIRRSERWKPRYTALFFTDLRIQWSHFQKQFSAKITSRTIVTENPEGKEAELLLNYAKDAPVETFEIVEQMLTSFPQPSTIQDVMSVKQIQDRINKSLGNDRSGLQQFTALLFSFITSLDLDGITRTVLRKCVSCKTTMNGPKCENHECPTIFDDEFIDPEISYDIKIMLTDHTGTLTNCRFRGEVAEKTLGCTASDFSNMSSDQKCQLKWKYLMERCAVSIAIMFVGRQVPVIEVLQLFLADGQEVARRLPIY